MGHSHDIVRSSMVLLIKCFVLKRTSYCLKLFTSIEVTINNVYSSLANFRARNEKFLKILNNKKKMKNYETTKAEHGT